MMSRIRCRTLISVALVAVVVTALTVPQDLSMLGQPQPSLAAFALAALPNMTTAVETPPLSNSTSFLGNLEAPPDTPIGCYHQTSKPRKEYRPIVLEDCYPLFGQMLLSYDVLVPRIWNPQRQSYRRQYGNCIFIVSPGIRAIPTSFSEISVGIDMARIVRECVTTRTGYLGGQKQQSAASGWIFSVVAAGPP